MRRSAARYLLNASKFFPDVLVNTIYLLNLVANVFIDNGLVFINTIDIKRLGNIIRLYYIYFIKIKQYTNIQNSYYILYYYGPSVISVTVTKGGHLRGSRLYGTSGTIGRGVSRVT